VRHRRTTPLVLAAVLLAACGGADDAEVTPADPAEATSDDAADGGSAAQVTILDDDGRRFEPAEVSVAVGDAVTWTHEGGLPHTVTATDGAFDSGTLAGGDTFAFTPEEAGTFDYVCSIHPEMTGTVTVS
jgi:plastocyanin